MTQNLLTEEEREFVDALQKQSKKTESKEVITSDIVRQAQNITSKKILEEVNGRLEKTLGVKETLDELFTFKEEDEKGFAAARKYIEDTFGKKAWEQLEERAEKQLKESQDDIDDWKAKKKGFGKNKSKNRKKRLIDAAEPLRKEEKEKYNFFPKDLSITSRFLDDLNLKRYQLEDNKDISIENFHEVSEELQSVVLQLGKYRNRDMYRKILSLEESTYLDQANNHEMAKKLEKLKRYIFNRWEIIQKLKDLQHKKEKEFYKTGAHITRILDKFPFTPDPDDDYPIDIVEGIKERGN